MKDEEGHMFDTLETPRLILDRDRLEANAARFRDRAAQLGVALRPHLKTSKCAEVGRIAKGGGTSGFTVSTLQEAEWFAGQGFSDILYATAITPNKFDRVARINAKAPSRLCLVTDDVHMANAAVAYTEENECDFDFMIEIDCGEHRSGMSADSEDFLEIAHILAGGRRTHLKGIMTHAGHSYSTDKPDEVRIIAESERRAAIDAADRLRAAGLPCETVSVGSSPTVLWADHLDGVTEVRAGIYLFWDLAQVSRNVCSQDDIAMTVLATVIGHNRAAGSLVVDAGALAMSRDVGANALLPDVHYGHVCDPLTLARIADLSIDAVHQEHGTVKVADPTTFDRLAVGSVVRILPNHACMTAAPYNSFTVLSGGRIVEEWASATGWLPPADARDALQISRTPEQNGGFAT